MTFGGFNGTVVLESNFVRKCAKCRRLIGRKTKGYSYGYRVRVDVCAKCHGRNFRRSHVRAMAKRPTKARK